MYYTFHYTAAFEYNYSAVSDLFCSAPFFVVRVVEQKIQRLRK